MTYFPKLSKLCHLQNTFYIKKVAFHFIMSENLFAHQTHQTAFEKGGRREGREWEYNGGVNLFKVHCTHV
jgi:hypothetical protein